jgi:AraC-like DNA-binding protein
MRTALVSVPSTVLGRLETLGLDVERVLRQGGLLRARFQVPRAQLAVAEYLAFWRAVEAQGAPDLGLRLGSNTTAHQLDIAGMAAIHSRDLAEALGKLERYKRVSCGPHLWVETRKEEARVGASWEMTEEEIPAVLFDGMFASVLTLARRGTGTEIVPRRLELTRPRAHGELLAAFFRCPVRFGAPVDMLVLDADLLARPFVTHNPDLLAVMLPGLEAELRDRPTSPSIADEVRSLLGRRLNGERPNIDAVARQLGTSARSLQRRLSDLGTSYQSLLDDVRHRAARRLLGEAGLVPAEVGFLLGYEELNSFSRAFHQWEGVTPERWRRTHSAVRAASISGPVRRGRSTAARERSRSHDRRSAARRSR